MKKTFIKLLATFAIISSAVGASAQTNHLTLNLDQDTRTFLRSAAEDKWFKKETLFSTLLGGILAIAGGFAATGLADTLQARRKRQEDVEFSKNVILSIRRELEAVRDIYNKGIGGRLKTWPKEQPFKFWLSMTQSWFTVFDSNAGNLGRIDGDISQKIITVYIRMKQLIEEFRINGEYINWVKESIAECERRPKEVAVTTRHVEINEMMLNQVTRMKESDKALTEAADELFKLLDQRGFK